MRIKPIETRYKGRLFRSRLEARWAVWFDVLGVTWEYEKEGFDVNGRWYLPDFWLPTWNRWVEIKPHTPLSDESINLLAGVSDFAKTVSFIFHGEPWIGEFGMVVIHPENDLETEEWSNGWPLAGDGSRKGIYYSPLVSCGVCGNLSYSKASTLWDWPDEPVCLPVRKQPPCPSCHKTHGLETCYVDNDSVWSRDGDGGEHLLFEACETAIAFRF